jgi:hypothetical protein
MWGGHWPDRGMATQAEGDEHTSRTVGDGQGEQARGARGEGERTSESRRGRSGTVVSSLSMRCSRGGSALGGGGAGRRWRAMSRRRTSTSGNCRHSRNGRGGPGQQETAATQEARYEQKARNGAACVLLDGWCIVRGGGCRPRVAAWAGREAPQRRRAHPKVGEHEVQHDIRHRQVVAQVRVAGHHLHQETPAVVLGPTAAWKGDGATPLPTLSNTTPEKSEAEQRKKPVSSQRPGSIPSPFTARMACRGECALPQSRCWSASLRGPVVRASPPLNLCPVLE